MLLIAAAFATPLQVDLHVDTPTQLLRRGVGLDDPALEAGLPKLRAGGTNIAVMVLWPPRGESEAHVETLLARVEAEDRRLEDVEVARTPDDARRIAGDGRVALLLSIEGAHGLEHEGLDGLRRFHTRGLALMELTWTNSNRYAGSSGDSGGGLTADGRALVAEAQRLGIVIDVSHASKQTTLDTCAVTRAPIIASHSDAAAVTAQPRNLSDEEIRCIAHSGGVIGINLHSTFVGRPADVRKVADHVDHLKAVGGVEVVALGSDFDGLIKPPPDIPDSSKLGLLWDELRRRGYTEPEIAMIRGENFLRAWAVCLNLR